MHQESQKDREVLAGIDAGGTTFKCCISTLDGQILARKRIPTTSPTETLSQCSDFLKGAAKEQNKKIAHLGVASFGPINVDTSSNTYGTILNTPKPNWSNTNLKSFFEVGLGVPVTIDTDVNGALLAEMASGAAVRCASAAYVTVGTGIGAGIFANGDLIGKPSHPEFGHICVQRHGADTFPGCCEFHGNCLEGMASATAFMMRSGDPRQLPASDLGWHIEAFYLAQACWSLSLSFLPERIILGGGLMQAAHLLSLVKEEYIKLAGGYLQVSEAGIDELIVCPGHGDDAGLIGGITLAQGFIKTL